MHAMLRTIRPPALLAALLALTAACNYAVDRQYDGFASETQAGLFFDNGLDGESRPRVANKLGSSKDASVALPSLPHEQSRKMIYSAGLSIEVARVEDAMRDALQQVEKIGGYMQEREGSSLVLRVPADSFLSFIEKLRELGRVLSESIKAQDVSREHKNLAIRLENVRKARQRLMALLDRAKEIGEILEIEKSLLRLTVEIEQLEAALEAMNSQIAYSSVRVAFNSPLGQGPRRRRPNRFQWINSVGVQNVLNRF